jgi:hypothetical protein
MDIWFSFAPSLVEWCKKHGILTIGQWTGSSTVCTLSCMQAIFTRPILLLCVCVYMNSYTCLRTCVLCVCVCLCVCMCVIRSVHLFAFLVVPDLKTKRVVVWVCQVFRTPLFTFIGTTQTAADGGCLMQPQMAQLLTKTKHRLCNLRYSSNEVVWIWPLQLIDWLDFDHST